MLTSNPRNASVHTRLITWTAYGGEDRVQVGGLSLTLTQRHRHTQAHTHTCKRGTLVENVTCRVGAVNNTI